MTRGDQELALWDAGEYEEFGKKIKLLRQRLGPPPWSQAQLAESIIDSIVSTGRFYERTLDDVRAKKARIGDTPTSDFEAATLEEISYYEEGLQAHQPLLEEIRDLAPSLIECIEAGIRHSDPGLGDFATDMFEAYAALKSKWRSRIANAETGRPGSRIYARAIVSELRSLANDAAEEDRNTYDARLKVFLRSIGYVPGPPFEETEGIWSDKTRGIDAPAAWDAAGADQCAFIAGLDYERLFREGTIIGIKSTPTPPQDRLLVVTTPDGILQLRILRDIGGTFYLDDPVEPAERRRWTRDWTINGLVVGSLLTDPEGFRVEVQNNI